LNNTKAQKRPLLYLFIGVFTGIIATGGIFYLLYSPSNKSTKSTTAEKVQTASSSASQEKIHQNTDADKIIQNAISRWKTAWEQKDINAYKTFYSPGFHTGEFDHRTWLDTKEKYFQRPGDISINIHDLTISVEGRRAVATFVQHHKSPGLTDKGIKTLIWISENDEWKIVSEKWKPLRK
jgi:murein L,D-transpeptidase YafK